MKKRFLTAPVLLFLLFSILLTSCGQKQEEIDPRLLPTEEDLTVVMTVNGIDVPFEEYRYFFLNHRRELYGENKALTDGQIKEIEALTIDNIKQNHALTLMAKEYGAALSKEREEEIDAYIRQTRSSFENIDAYLASLKEGYLTDHLFTTMTRESQLSYVISEQLVTKGEIDSSDENVKAILAGDDVIRIKVIFVSNDLQKDAEAVAKDLRKTLEEGSVDFETLMKESSDFTEADFPTDEGYYMVKYDLYDEIWDAAVKLKDGEVSDVIASAGGFYLIKRYEKDPAYLEKNSEDIFTRYIYSVCEEKINELIASMNAEYTEAGKTMDLADLK